MGLLKNFDILNAKIIDGLYFPLSREHMVCLDTFKISANFS